MLGDACPECGSPLFKLKSGDVVCPQHGKVVIVKDDQEELKVKSEVLLSQVEERLIQGLERASGKIREAPEDPDVVNQVIRYLEALERVRRIRK
ncbi:Sjogren's syndrome/scleroderma autoantigen 1 family protein [Sulfodiicoccus acidiphilus]